MVLIALGARKQNIRASVVHSGEQGPRFSKGFSNNVQWYIVPQITSATTHDDGNRMWVYVCVRVCARVYVAPFLILSISTLASVLSTIGRWRDPRTRAPPSWTPSSTCGATSRAPTCVTATPTGTAPTATSQVGLTQVHVFADCLPPGVCDNLRFGSHSLPHNAPSINLECNCTGS